MRALCIGTFNLFYGDIKARISWFLSLFAIALLNSDIFAKCVVKADFETFDGIHSQAQHTNLDFDRVNQIFKIVCMDIVAFHLTKCKTEIINLILIKFHINLGQTLFTFQTIFRCSVLFPENTRKK